MNLYFISGLGADEKAFARIQLKNVNVIHIRWEKHSKSDNLSSYVQKLLPQIDSSKPFILVALSFGGIIAQELCKVIQPKKTILISSVNHHSQFPWFYQFGKYIIPLLPNTFFKQTNFFVNYLFGATGKNKTVLNTIFKSNDPTFIKWCILQLLRWRQSNTLKDIISIHGTYDKIIPFHSCDYKIENGSHFMVYTKAKQIQKIIQEEINLVTND